METVNSQIKPERIMEHTYSIYSSLAMLAGMQLDLFSFIEGEPKSAAIIARELQLDEEKLEPLLYALVGSGLLTINGDLFSNLEESSAFLVKGNNTYLGGAAPFYETLWKAAMNTAKSVKTGKPQSRIDYGSASEEFISQEIASLYPGTKETGKTLARRLDLKRYSSLLDVGGGNGGIAIGACQSIKHQRAVVVDLPDVVKVATHFVREEGMEDRISTVGINIVDESPPGSYDAAVLRSFIQVLSPGEARKALENVASVLQPGGALFIIGRILDNTRLYPQHTVLMNLVFINIYNQGRAYAECDYTEWLLESGFHNIEFHHDFFDDGQSILSAVKK